MQQQIPKLLQKPTAVSCQVSFLQLQTGIFVLIILYHTFHEIKCVCALKKYRLLSRCIQKAPHSLHCSLQKNVVCYQLNISALEMQQYPATLRTNWPLDLHLLVMAALPRGMTYPKAKTSRKTREMPSTFQANSAEPVAVWCHEQNYRWLWTR